MLVYWTSFLSLPALFFFVFFLLKTCVMRSIQLEADLKDYDQYCGTSEI
jgi:hypothetical protein